MHKLLSSKKLRKYVLFSVIAVFGFTTIAQPLYAFDKDFFSSNDIIFYDDSCGNTPVTGSTGPLVGGDNVEKVYRYLISKQQTAIGAAAITGNLMWESHLSPTITNSIGAHGIAQWYQGRRTALSQYEGSKADTLEGQLDFLWHEGQTTEKKAWDTVKTATSLLGGSGLPSGGANGAVYKWEEIFEVAGDPLGGFAMNNRMKNAAGVYASALSKGWGGGGTIPNAPSSCGDTGLTNINGCVNPFQKDKKDWALSRTDQGVDYVPLKPLPVYAVCDGKILYSDPSGWGSFGAFMSYKLTSGPPQVIGKCIYVAEHLSNLAPAGKMVKAGDVIATAIPGSPYTEWGWAGNGDGAEATPYNGATDGTPMPGGKAFARFIRALGGSSQQNPGPGPIYPSPSNNCK